MSRLLEHHAKMLLTEAGIDIPRSEVVTSPAAAAEFAATATDGVVLKALVAATRKAKSGLVRFADDPAAAEREASELFKQRFEDTPIERLLIEEKVAIDRELFYAITIDKTLKQIVAVASLAGGIDIEEAARDNPLVVGTVEIDSLARILPHRLRRLWASLGLSGPSLPVVVDACVSAAQVFFESDATILELNPLAVVENDGGPQVVAVGAAIAIDNNAFARQPELARLAVTDRGWRAPTILEQDASGIAAFEPYRGTARFIELEGDVALLVGGGGGSLVYFDAVRRAGGRPACYTEIGGNPSAEKVRRLTKVVLSCPGVRGLLVGHNITNNTQVDLIAAGVVEALKDLQIDTQRFPVVAREVGTNDDVGRTIFEEAGIEYLGEEATMDQAARLIVERVSAIVAAS